MVVPCVNALFLLTSLENFVWTAPLPFTSLKVMQSHLLSSSMQVQQIASAQRTAPMKAQRATQHGLQNGLLGSKLHVRQSCTAARFGGATAGHLHT